MEKQIHELYLDAWNRYSLGVMRHCAYYLRNTAVCTACCRAVFNAYYTALQKGQPIEFVGAWLYKEADKKIKLLKK